MHTRNWHWLLASGLALLWLSLAGRPLHAAGVVGDGAPDSCTDAAFASAFAGGGLVTFDCGPNLIAITVTTRVVNSSETTVVDGGGLVALDGANLRQLFLVLNGGSLTLRNIVLQNGSFDNGGAAFVAQGATLRLEAVTIRDSEADGSDSDGGAVQNRGALVVDSSTFLRNHADDGGGAINNNGGSVTIRSSTFISNTALNGGAINNAAGNLAISASLLLSSTAGNQGGGLFATSGSITMTNVTVARNAAFRGGGLYAQNDALISVLNNTIYSNTASSAGGGIWNNTEGAAANVILKNTIVAANNNPVGDVLNCDGWAMRTLGHNLIGDGSCITPQTGDLPNSNPLLGPLAANGSRIGSYAPQPGSPAIDAGDNSGCPATDQRGYPRPINAICDIGAVEYGYGLWLPLLRKG